VKILLACDKFKGSLDSIGVNTAIAKGWKKKHPNSTIVVLPLADGGDGTLVVLANALNLSFIDQLTIDPIGRAITAPYLQDGDTAYFELAAASGIENKQEVIPAGGNLSSIVALDTQQMVTINQLTILCDVSNPLYGSDGAAHVFARQKGASEAEIHFLDRGLRHVAQLIEKHTGRSISKLSGGGAAGGIAAGLTGFFNTEIVNGFDFIKEKTDLETQIKTADLVITGEGQLDKTSLDGKVVGGVAALCQQYGKSLIAVVGNSTLSIAEKEALGLDQIYTVLERAGSVEVAIRDTSLYLEEIGQCLLFSQG